MSGISPRTAGATAYGIQPVSYTHLDVYKRQIQKRVESLCEHYPMLGHRGCRLGNTYPEITEMQTRDVYKRQSVDRRNLAYPLFYIY